MRWRGPGAVGLRGRVTALVTLAVLLSSALAFGALALLAPVQLDAAVDDGLRQRAADLVPDTAAGLELSDPLAQVLDRRGRVLAGQPTPLLSTAQLSSAVAEDRAVDVDVPSLGGDLRAVVVPLDADRSLVVATRLGPLLVVTDRVVAGLAVVFAVLVVLVPVGTWIVVGAVLRPVAAMTRTARRMGARPGPERLPQPGTGDEVDRLADTFNDLLGRVEEAFVRERGFVDDASHELRTPLTLLQGELELAADDTDPAKLRDGVRRALVASRRLSALAEDLLVLARLDDGSAHRPSPVDPVACVRAAAALVPQLSVEVVAARPVVAVADRVALERVLVNLLRNSLAVGARRSRVTVLGAAGGLELVLEDDGPGFPPAFLPHAFERFSRADDARGQGGTGLGLAITAAVARAHGGSARAGNDSALGGARVRLHLPG